MNDEDDFTVFEKDSLANCHDVAAARELRSLMSEISEDYYAAGWLVGLEFSLWHIVFEDNAQHFGFGPISFKEIGKLIELTQRCQGWWIWSDEDGGCKFLNYDEWLPIYQRGYKN